MQRANLEALNRAGVSILIGSDQQVGAAIDEARYLVMLGVMTPRQALDALTRTTPQFIFPGRRIGRLAAGYEASFLVLDADPAGDLMALPDAIATRIKQGAEMQGAEQARPVAGVAK